MNVRDQHMQTAGTAHSSSLERAGFELGPRGPRIPVPAKANIAADTVGRHARGERADATALIVDRPAGVRTWTFRELDDAANRLAAGLAANGLARGDRIAVHMGQSAETALAHLAAYKLGAIVVTLSQLYGPETVRHALADCEPRYVVTEHAAWLPLADMAASLPSPIIPIWCGECEIAGGISFRDLTEHGLPPIEPVDTAADEPALLMYTSGSTGLPKGLLHAHRILHAYMPTITMFYDLELDRAGSVFWTPADWAWVGGLLDLLLPAWWAGQPVVCSNERFDAEQAFALIERHRVTHAFVTPTGLKRLAEVSRPRERWDIPVRVICTGGESLPGEIVRWCGEELGAVCNEFYGLTEFNHLVGNCARLYPPRPGSMGRAYPGHRTTIVDEAGNPLADGEIGEIVAAADDPTLFLGYWGRPGIPDALKLGTWLRTRDLAWRDADGYFWYQGRNDDLIKSAGYRIGPAEVEDTLLRHPAVAEAAVVASPDPDRGAIVKAFVRLARGHQGSDTLAAELQAFVKTNLAAYKYPRKVEFVDSFPLTSSGKIRRGELRRREYEASEAG